MINDVTPANQAGEEENKDEQITELREDMEMVSPGAMLGDARKALSLSQEYISSKLNFKVGIVKDMENDIFDPLMPVTFNRGYLANYAKLVGVAVDEVLASYDALDAASIQRSEMLSFSRETAKQAEHSRVMWLSYLIVAVLIGLTVLWWLQEGNQQTSSSSVSTFENVTEDISENTVQNKAEPSPVKEVQKIDMTSDDNLTLSTAPEQVLDENIINSTSALTSEVKPEKEPETVATLSTAVFTFKGDCWVNIYDATGERVAWGVKKSGYVMTIQGKAPLRITVGKPELTSIVFNGQPVDMSTFNVGNIAKFNLPIVE
ncbi:RodZ domain-containing protein [Colwellia psychrerythraea]|uniref:Putative transcriptional regulator n=1 Tax=Colwellia psychrerythraea TaxID=28229 RepID=A0A099KK90_COLPS|nr:RodZ domain-containing protein [Colwellia psychrerythraea]KGJ90650.1 putative transcriptional regulator [Colwellia psychrerythraea]